MFRRQLNLLLVTALFAATLVLPILIRPVSTCVVGDARFLRNGVIPDALRAVQLDAQKMKLGIGAAAIDGWNDLGDAVVVGGQAWLRPTNSNAPNFYGLAHGRYFRSSAFTYAPASIGKKRRIIWRPVRSSSMDETWEKLGRDFPGGVMASGYIRFETLHLIAIAAPAIHGKSTESDAAYYYTQPMETASDVWAFVVGLTVSNTQSRFAFSINRERLNSFTNPNKPTRVYALRLNNPPSDISRPPRSDDIVAVGEVVGHSKAAAGELELLPMIRVAACRDAFAGTSG